MNQLNVLLLDCSSDLEQQVRRAGFNVASGSVGFCDGIQRLPGPIYDYEVIVYNPMRYGLNKQEQGATALGPPPPPISYATPMYKLGDIRTHVYRNITILAFVNPLTDDESSLNEVYGWIPDMPRIVSTHDQLVEPVDFGPFNPMLRPEELRLPVKTKLAGPYRTTSALSAFRPVPTPQADIVWSETPGLLFINKNDEALGMFLWSGRRRASKMFLLPTYKSNDEICIRFLTRIVPQLYESKSREGLDDQFRSPIEKEAEDHLAQIAASEDQLQREREEYLARLATAKRQKKQLIQGDDTARLLLMHYERAIREPEDAYIHLYKVRDTLKHKFDGENQAIEALDCKAPWKCIGDLTNRPERNARHTPKPGETIVEWTKEDHEHCFSAARELISKYFDRLFQSSTRQAPQSRLSSTAEETAAG